MLNVIARSEGERSPPRRMEFAMTFSPCNTIDALRSNRSSPIDDHTPFIRSISICILPPPVPGVYVDTPLRPPLGHPGGGKVPARLCPPNGTRKAVPDCGETATPGHASGSQEWLERPFPQASKSTLPNGKPVSATWLECSIVIFVPDYGV